MSFLKVPVIQGDHMQKLKQAVLNPLRTAGKGMKAINQARRAPFVQGKRAAERIVTRDNIRELSELSDKTIGTLTRNIAKPFFDFGKGIRGAFQGTGETLSGLALTEKTNEDIDTQLKQSQQFTNNLVRKIKKARGREQERLIEIFDDHVREGIDAQEKLREIVPQSEKRALQIASETAGVIGTYYLASMLGHAAMALGKPPVITSGSPTQVTNDPIHHGLRDVGGQVNRIQGGNLTSDPVAFSSKAAKEIANINPAVVRHPDAFTEAVKAVLQKHKLLNQKTIQAIENTVSALTRQGQFGGAQQSARPIIQESQKALDALAPVLQETQKLLGK